MNTSLYLNGLKKAAKTMKGNEKIHLGIRPYALHAGNILTIVTYPLLLCEELEQNGKIAKFNFIVSINDWEQAALLGENIHKYNFDIKPDHTTLEFTNEKNGKKTVDYWEKVIQKKLKIVSSRYPNVKINTIRNSSLKDDKAMKHVILSTIKSQSEIKKIMLNSSGIQTNGSKSYLANAICPNCKHANTNTKIDRNSTLILSCDKCNRVVTGKYEDFSYWLHHKPMFAARWKIFDFTYSISGGDHYLEGDHKTRKALFEYYFNKPAPKINMIFSPILIASDGQKMSKSRGNIYSVGLDEILQIARKCEESEIRPI